MMSDLAIAAQVILIDLALAGDNAVAVGLAAAALPAKQQRQVIVFGIALALVLRIAFALVTVQLLAIKGLLLAGGLLLLWVAWRMWQDISRHRSLEAGLERAEHMAEAQGGARAAGALKAPSFGRALTSIVIADVSMSLDNVLAVAGVARESPALLAFGLVLSVVLMGVAAGFIAGVIERFRWIATIGVIVIVYAAIRMIWEDLHVFFPAQVPAMPVWLGGHAPQEAGF